MIKVVCDKCRNELNVPGALLFSPPDKNNFVKKFHLCTRCYEDVMRAKTGN